MPHPPRARPALVNGETAADLMSRQKQGPARILSIASLRRRPPGLRGLPLTPQPDPLRAGPRRTPSRPRRPTQSCDPPAWTPVLVHLEPATSCGHLSPRLASGGVPPHRRLRLVAWLPLSVDEFLEKTVRACPSPDDEGLGRHQTLTRLAPSQPAGYALAQHAPGVVALVRGGPPSKATSSLPGKGIRPDRAAGDGFWAPSRRACGPAHPAVPSKAILERCFSR